MLASVLLNGCIPPEEQARMLVGSWTGNSGGGRWCITYREDHSLNVIFRTPSGEHEKLEEGRYMVKRGGRLTHTLIRQREPKEITDRARFFLRGISANEFTYRSDLTKHDYTNQRIESCENF